MAMAGLNADTSRADRYRVSVDQYLSFKRTGFLAVRNLVSPPEIEELRQHTVDLMNGRLPRQADGADLSDLAPPAHLSPDEKAQHFLRIHMLHRRLELHERYMLHPRVLDVLEVIIGPDVLAMQTMLFLKPPGKPGQGWHQDTHYIPTHPDSLCGAWIAIDDCDERNGAMWMAAGSGIEPIYPPREGGLFGERLIADIPGVSGVSNTDDQANDLARVADKYPQVLVTAKAGDVVFFNGHVLHRSKQNFSIDRYRRSFVSHYCNARSFTQWGAAQVAGDVHGAPVVDPQTLMTNGSHILARGDTHLPFAKPKFGTSCAATQNAQQRRNESAHVAATIADMAKGEMEAAPADPTRADDDDAVVTAR